MDVKIKSIRYAQIVLFLGLCATMLATYYSKLDVDLVSNRNFKFACNEINTKINTRLHAHAQILRSGSALFSTTGAVTRKQWKTFIEHANISLNLPGIQGIGFSVLIPEDSLQNHVNSVRSEGFHDYSIKPAGNRKLYSSIIYLEPFSGRNLRAFGYDMFADSIRRNAMERARDNNVAALSGKVTLVQETAKDIQAGTLMYVPVYRNSANLSTVSQRRKAIIGWIYSPYRMNDLMAGILGGWNLKEENKMHLQIFDGADTTTKALLYECHKSSEIYKIKDVRFSEQIPLNFNTHRWTLFFSQSGNGLFNAEYWRVWIIFFGGIIISVLLFMLMMALVRIRKKALEIATKLTNDLKESEAKYRAIFNNEIYALCILDIQTLQFIEINDAFASIYEYNKEDVKNGLSLHQVTNEPEASSLFITKIAAKETTFVPLRYHRKKDGTVFPVEIVGGAFLWKGKNVVYSIIHDISFRKGIEEKLQNSQVFLNTIINENPFSIWISDDLGTLVRINKACCNLLDISEEEVLYKYNILLDNIVDEQGVLPVVKNVFEHAEIARFELLYDTSLLKNINLKTSKKNLLDITIFPILNPQGKVTNAVIQCIDITARKHAEALIIQQINELRELNIQKDKFFSIVAHDLKSPFNALFGFTELLSTKYQHYSEEKKYSFIQMISKSSKQIFNLLENLLEWSRSQRGQIELNKTNVVLHVLVHDIVNLFEQTTAAKCITILAEIPENVVAFADENLVKTVLRNLIGNAVKFTNKGGLVHVKAEIQNTTILVSVSDDGVGIKPENIGSLFQIGANKSQSGTDGEKGTGLGLMLCKEFVEKNDGRIWVESSIGKGSCFYFTLKKNSS